MILTKEASKPDYSSEDNITYVYSDRGWLYVEQVTEGIIKSGSNSSTEFMYGDLSTVMKKNSWVEIIRENGVVKPSKTIDRWIQNYGNPLFYIFRIPDEIYQKVESILVRSSGGSKPNSWNLQEVVDDENNVFNVVSFYAGLSMAQSLGAVEIASENLEEFDNVYFYQIISNIDEYSGFDGFNPGELRQTSDPDFQDLVGEQVDKQQIIDSI